MRVLQDQQVYPGVWVIWLMPRGADLVQSEPTTVADDAHKGAE